ncbi:ComF family protein [Clostridium fermenticellae]|uniref:ComF family protein n=1 Tax=Clostridium fermenticellae TaxID=2068654 RepID=A0A386H0P8_9CLOT|nr:ComF family protein [Clostridium fermenticellae]AYD39216.1 ComF family protein [Clostridium fermenticellae]
MGTGIIKNLKFLKECLLSVIYASEQKCIVCNKELYNDRFICSECREDIKLCKNAFCIKKDGMRYEVYSAAYYSKTVMELIISLKYKNNFDSGRLLASYMINIIKLNNIQFDYITYVPMTKASLKDRGYNQSKYISKIISDEIDIPVINCLKKIKSTKDQIGLGGVQRWANMKDSFKYIARYDIEGKNILVIDDVITTGATAYYCAEQLTINGARKVSILTAAKSRV